MKNKISLFSVFAVIAGISLVAFGVTFIGKAQSQQNNDKKEVRVRQYDKEKKISQPTVIQEGVMSAKQKKHSKIFKGYKDRAKLRELMAQRGDVEVMQPVGNVITPRSFNLSSYLQTLSCKADAVVVGKVKNKASQINEDGTFVFTDYELTAEDVLKDNALASINPSANITVTRTGGAVKLNGHTARAIDYRQLPLIEDEQYLLFLKFVPETGSYQSLHSSRDEDSFQILGNRMIQQVSGKPLPFRGLGPTDLNIFMSEVRAALNSACQNQGGAE